MKLRFLVVLGAAAAEATSTPLLDWDPNTVESCVEWYNNGMGETCEYIRDYFGITPEQFSSWNPSIGLDCKPWEFQSYCIVTKERNEEYSRTHTTTTTTTTKTTETSSITALGPSPTSWADKGCFVEGTDTNILQKSMSGDGDDGLTIPKCQDLCYRERTRFTGLKNGNQCWCSNYVIGDHATNQTDCNLPCSGDKATICGGKDRINVFDAQYQGLLPIDSRTWSASSGTCSSAGTPSSAGTQASHSSSVYAAQSTSGAMRNAIIFGNFGRA
ncbi:hypothetical protein G3M48_002466 [Beauveria asiatica]|uniref:WSC domain-containing protein n=1 Tax=Beauveria asiatica TaxID=1069075 RepID=A0AAW0RYI2_9HYPO